tara:strand:+ start:135476 stop:136510 length:1035 start_codon:yes stop_codon:yes gene_type:complete
MKKLSLFNKVIFLLNVFFALVLVLSYTTQNIAPSSVGVSPLLSLVVPLLILVNILFVSYWILMGFKKQLFLSLIILIIGIFISPPLYKLGADTSDSGKESLSILSYNVRKFNIFNWIKDENISSEINSFVKNENPDIVVMQEFKKSKDFNLNYPYHYDHHDYSQAYKKDYPSGLVIFSKYPIINSGAVQFRRFYSSMIFTDIVKNKDTFRVYNFHLESLGVDPNREYFGHKDSQKLFDRLGRSFKTQQTEIETLNAHIANCNYKVILAGDMNNTAYSWTYKNLKGNLQDSYVKRGNGFGRTYNFKGFPLRIDVIFADKKMKIIDHKNYDVHYSDHYPIMATIEY